jgi:superfamily I DNA/RNA helicase
LPEAISDVDGLIENRNGTISLFDGPPPELRLYKDTDAEAEGVALWLTELVEEGVPIEDIALFVRCDSQFDRAAMAANAAGYSHRRLNELNGPDPGGLAIGTMHNAKGLEFRAVVVMACDEDILPLQSRLEAAGDDSDLKEFYDTERHLLYVACTRARDHLLVTAVEPGSEFLLDFSDTSQA